VVDIPFPTSNAPGRAPGEGAGRLVNCYAYSDGAAPRWRPLPGLLDFSTLPFSPIRGMMENSGLLIVVAGQSVFLVVGDGTFQALEERVYGDGPVTIARNNASIPQVTISGSGGAFVIDGTVLNGYPDPDLPTPNSVTFLDGFFLWTTAGGVIWASGLNDEGIDALSQSKAEARPDGLLRGIVAGEQFFAMGTETIEVWQDAGTAPFPLSRSTVIPIGLLAQWAVAGFEPGWGGPLIFVADDGSVRSLDGYTPTRISTEDLERLIETVADKRTLIASVHTFGGNLIWSLSSPDWTWEFNVTTSKWHERQSYGASRWKGGLTAKAFGKWIVADRSSGQLYALDPETRSEGGDPLVWGLDSGPVKQFPSRIQVPGAAFDFVLGQGALGANPQVMLSWSHDGGGRWANPITRSLQKQGAFAGRVSINRVGLSSPAGVRWRFRVSDPAYTSFAGGRMDAVDRK
jgi:hypothetical protein